MRAFVTAICAAFVLSFVAASHPAAADESFTIDFTLPYDETFENTCSGEFVNFHGTSHIVISVDAGFDSYHYKLHANGNLSGDVVAPVPALDVYTASQTEDYEDTVSAGNDITNLVTTFVAVNHVDPHVNMKLITEFQINFKSKTLFNFHTTARCELFP